MLRTLLQKLQGVLKNVPYFNARSHDSFLRIRFLLASKIGLCEHIENDLPTHGSVILKKRMKIQSVPRKVTEF